MSRSRFDAVAQEYDAGRPGYPDDLFDAIEELSGSFLEGAVLADVGAGTGISARGLIARGARVIAVDHGTSMLATLRRRTPAASAVLADANELPFRDGSLDLVTFAQSWHWVDLARAPQEVLRVLRPGGALAIWWNTADEDGEQWLHEHRARLRVVGQEGVGARFRAAWQSIPSAFDNLDVETTSVKWHRTVPMDVILDEVRSKSYIAELGTAGADAFVERERALLPSGLLRQPFVTQLAVVRMPA
jgi:SAM-dependent methyltransferase